MAKPDTTETDYSIHVQRHGPIPRRTATTLAEETLKEIGWEPGQQIAGHTDVQTIPRPKTIEPLEYTPRGTGSRSDVIIPGENDNTQSLLSFLQGK